MRISFGAAALVALLGACGSPDSGGNMVSMQNMEAVDGTATDAMTDLDAARNDGTPILGSGNNATPAAAATEEVANAAAKDAEVVAQD